MLQLLRTVAADYVPHRRAAMMQRVQRWPAAVLALPTVARLRETLASPLPRAPDPDQAAMQVYHLFKRNL